MSSLFSSGLVAHRRERGLTQADLARAAGVTRQAIGAIEAGRAQPSVTIALALARTLGKTVEELFAARNEEQIDADLASPPAGGRRRVAVAIVDGRVVARPLDRHGAPAGEPAAAFIASASRGTARIEPIAERRTFEATVFISGCDPALALLAGHVNAAGGRAVWFSASNRDALYDLADHRTHVASIHGTEGEIRRLTRRVAGDVRIVELATIEAGWIVARDNPLKLTGVRDLERPSVRLANRPPGSAARALLESELRRAGIQAGAASGYDSALEGHADVARAIAFGYADLGIAVGAVAETFDLGFIPLRTERCVLAIRQGDLAHPGVVALVRSLESTAFRRDLAAFGPYDVERLGEPLR